MYILFRCKIVACGRFTVCERSVLPRNSSLYQCFCSVLRCFPPSFCSDETQWLPIIVPFLQTNTSIQSSSITLALFSIKSRTIFNSNVISVVTISSTALLSVRQRGQTQATAGYCAYRLYCFMCPFVAEQCCCQWPDTCLTNRRVFLICYVPII